MSSGRSSAVPDGGWGWMVVLGSALAHFLVVSLGRCFGLFYTAIIEKYNTTAADAAWVVAIYNGIRMTGGPFAGMLSERFTCRVIVFVGGIVAAVGCISGALAPSLLLTYLGFGILTGVGGSLVFTPSYVIVGKYFDKKKGKAMSFATLGAGLGSVALAPIISLSLNEFGYFGAMLIMGGLMLNNCVAASLYRPPPKRNLEELTVGTEVQYHSQDNENVETKLDPMSDRSDIGSIGNLHTAVEEDKGVATDGKRLAADSLPNNSGLQNSDEGTKSTGKRSRFVNIWKTISSNFSIMTNPLFVLYFFQISAMACCLQSFLTFLPDLAILRGIDKRLSALLLSFIGASDMAGRFVTGFIFDIKFFRTRRRMLHSMLGIAFSSLAIVTGFCTSYAHFVALCLVFGIMEGGYHSQRVTVLSEFTRKEQASSATGFTIASQAIGNLVGPPIGGMLKDRTGDYVVTYIFCGIPLLILTTAFLIQYFYSATRGRKNERQTTVVVDT